MKIHYSFLINIDILEQSFLRSVFILFYSGIINTIIEACPSPGHAQSSPVFKPQQTSMNNIVKILLKKGLVIDLARIAYNMDMASPNMAMTVNCALKPLETLSRVVNHPQNVITKNNASKSKQPSTADEVSANNPPLGMFFV